MPLVMRGIRKRRWDKTQFPPWLAEDDVPADLLSDLRTSDNTLSVWLIQEDQCNLDLVVIAQASMRQKPEHFDYLLFDFELLEQLGIALERTPGNTEFTDANPYHRLLLELSGNRLVALSKAILRSDYSTGRKFGPYVKEELIRAVESGIVARERLNNKMQKYLFGAVECRR